MNEGALSSPGGSPTRLALGRDESGFALLIVLWIFMVLFVIGAEFSTEMRQDAQATVNFADETQSYYLAAAAINRTFLGALVERDQSTLGASPEEFGPEYVRLIKVDGVWNKETLWDAPVWVRVIDESGKVPINLADQPVLQQILINLGVPLEDASAIADSIIDWRDEDDEHRVGGAESEYYMDLPRPYVAKNAPLDSLEELRLVKGVTDELFFGGEEHAVGLQDLFSVFNREPTLNIRSATPEVLQAVLGLDEEQMKQFMLARMAGGGALLEGLSVLLPNPAMADLLADEPPSILLIEAQAKLPSARVGAHVGAVVDLGESHEGVYILRWMDQLPIAEVS